MSLYPPAYPSLPGDYDYVAPQYGAAPQMMPEVTVYGSRPPPNAAVSPLSSRQRPWPPLANYPMMSQQRPIAAQDDLNDPENLTRVLRNALTPYMAVQPIKFPDVNSALQRGNALAQAFWPRGS